MCAEVRLDITEKLTDHFSTTIMSSAVDHHEKKTTDKVDFNTFGEAVLRATRGLSNPEVGAVIQIVLCVFTITSSVRIL